MPVTMSYAGQAVATFMLPQVNARAGVDNILSLTQRAVLPSQAVFTDFGVGLLLQDSVTAHLSGMATISTEVFGLTLTLHDIPFEKDVSIAGAGGLRQSEVLDFSLATSTGTTAVANLTVRLTNPSVASILPLGDLQVGIFYQGSYMGAVTARNASLTPGPTTLNLVGNLINSNTTSIQNLISAYLGGATVNVTAVGQPCECSTPLYGGIIQALRLTAGLQGGATPLVNGVQVDGMYLYPVDQSHVLIRLNATVMVNNLLGPDSPIYVRSVALNVSLEGAGMPLGQLVVPTTNITGARRLLTAGGAGAPAPLDEAAARLQAASRLADEGLLGPPFQVASAGGPPLLFSTTPDGAAPSSRGPLGDPLPILNVTLAVEAVLDVGATEGFSDFIKAFLNSDTVVMGLIGTGASSMVVTLDCALGPLVVSIPLVARTTVPGIGGFPYVSVDSFAVMGTQDEPVPAITVALNVTLLNPSPASFPLGANSTLAIYVDGIKVGSSTAYNRTLVPGYNTLMLTGTLAPPPAALPAAASLFSSYLNGMPGTVTVVGESVYLAPGQVTPEWLVDAVQNISLAATVPGAANLTLLTNLTTLDLFFDFMSPEPGGDDGIPLMGGAVSAIMHLPFSVPVTVGSVDVNLSFVDPVSGSVLGSLTLVNQTGTYTPCNGSNVCDGADMPGNAPPVGALGLALSATRLQLGDLAGFQELIKQALTQPTATVRLLGKAAPTVNLNIGSLQLANVTIDETVTLVGMNGLQYPPAVVTSASVTSADPAGLNLLTTLNLTNPSVVRGRLGNVTLDILYEGVTLAQTFLTPLEVGRGMNPVVAGGRFFFPPESEGPAALATAQAFLSNYLNGFGNNVTLRGSAASSPYALLQPAFAALTTATSFVGLDTRLLVSGNMYVNLSAGLADIPKRANTTLTLRNPLPMPLTMLNASLTVFQCITETLDGVCQDQRFGYGSAIGFFYDGDLSLRPITAPGNSVYTTDLYEIVVLASNDSIIALAIQNITEGDAATKVNGSLTVDIGGFIASLYFEQLSVPLYLRDLADMPSKRRLGAAVPPRPRPLPRRRLAELLPARAPASFSAVAVGAALPAEMVPPASVVAGSAVGAPDAGPRRMPAP
jgi:hypothetical protein